MRAELARRFPGTRIGGIDRSGPLDLLTGTYGACSVAAIFGIPIFYAADNWPNCAHRYLDDEAVDALAPPNLDRNAFFQELMRQVDWIAAREGRAEGFLNWQGVLNNAYRLRGEQLFYDMVEAPDRARNLFECVTTTMLDAAMRLHAQQRETGVCVNFFTVSNCLVNMVSPAQYQDLLLPFDQRIAEAYGCIGIHNCAWTADPYIEHYAAVPHLAYVDGTGLGSAPSPRSFPARAPGDRVHAHGPRQQATGRHPGGSRTDRSRLRALRSGPGGHRGGHAGRAGLAGPGDVRS